MEKSLANYIEDIKNPEGILELTESDIEQILAIICKQCRARTWSRCRSNLTYSLSHVPIFGILSRLTKDYKGDWSYCAGQSYPDEIRTVRNIIKDLK